MGDLWGSVLQSLLHLNSPLPLSSHLTTSHPVCAQDWHTPSLGRALPSFHRVSLTACSALPPGRLMGTSNPTCPEVTRDLPSKSYATPSLLHHTLWQLHSSCPHAPNLRVILDTCLGTRPNPSANLLGAAPQNTPTAHPCPACHFELGHHFLVSGLSRQPPDLSVGFYPWPATVFSPNSSENDSFRM